MTYVLLDMLDMRLDELLELDGPAVGGKESGWEVWKRGEA